MIVIQQLLCLVRDGCLWLEEPIPINDMLIHRITWIPYSRLNPTMEFGGNTYECNLAEQMMDNSKLAKKSRGYSISSIIDPAVKLATQILAGKIMLKCHVDEMPQPVISLAA